MQVWPYTSHDRPSEKIRGGIPLGQSGEWPLRGPAGCCKPPQRMLVCRSRRLVTSVLEAGVHAGWLRPQGSAFSSRLCPMYARVPTSSHTCASKTWQSSALLHLYLLAYMIATESNPVPPVLPSYHMEVDCRTMSTSANIVVLLISTLL
jgi:hypothetical protein